MDALIIFLIAGTAMSLFLIPVVAIYATLEADYIEKEMRQFARKQIMAQMEREQELENVMKQITR
jgi:predicted PurR-regulated permease PerM